MLINNVHIIAHLKSNLLNESSRENGRGLLWSLLSFKNIFGYLNMSYDPLRFKCIALGQLLLFCNE